MNSVGAILKAERERQGRELAEIAEELCITQSYLRAIERDDLRSLPGSFFYKSFVKQYASILHVDETLLQPGVEALTAPLEPLPLPGADSRYTPLAQSGNPLGGSPLRHLDPIVRDGNRRYFPDRRIGLPLAGLAAMVLATSGFYAWYNNGGLSRAKAQISLSVPPALDSSRVAAQKVSAPVPTASPGSAPSIDVTTMTGPDGVNRVVLNLSATEKTWLSITSDGKKVFSGILEPSQTKTLTGLEAAQMKVGNAGGIEVRWNGKPIGPIGPRGQVRVVLFTPDNFQILPPPSTL